MTLEDEILKTMDAFTQKKVFDIKVNYLLHLYKVSPPLKRYFVWQKLKEMGVNMTVCQMREHC